MLNEDYRPGKPPISLCWHSGTPHLAHVPEHDYGIFGQSRSLRHLGVRGGGGGGIFEPKKKVIFRQNHFIFEQAMEKIFGQETSAPAPPRTQMRSVSAKDMYVMMKSLA